MSNNWVAPLGENQEFETDGPRPTAQLLRYILAYIFSEEMSIREMKKKLIGYV
jgi:hypothetical protein